MKQKYDAELDSKSIYSESYDSFHKTSHKSESQKNLKPEQQSGKSKKTALKRTITKNLRMALKRNNNRSLKKPPLAPKNPLWTEIRLKDNLRYICRLNNHLTYDEINERTAFQTKQRIG